MTELWKKKDEAHKWFDKLWKNHEERDVYYRRLAEELNMTYEECHFSMMTIDQLEKAIVVIKKWWFEKYDR